MQVCMNVRMYMCMCVNENEHICMSVIMYVAVHLYSCMDEAAECPKNIRKTTILKVF